MSNPHIADRIRQRINRNLQRAVNTGESLIRNPERMQARTDAAIALRALWVSLIPANEGVPDLTSFFAWLDRFGITTMEQAVTRTSQKSRSKRNANMPFTVEEAARYASSVAANISRELTKT